MTMIIYKCLVVMKRKKYIVAAVHLPWGILLRDCGSRNHLDIFCLTCLKRAGGPFVTVLGPETGISIETRALSALRVLWARGLRISAELDTPEAWMVTAVANAESRRDSRRFELVSRVYRDESEVLAGGDSAG